ncbi:MULTISPECIES: cyclase family protein [Brevibacillus]|jgi:Predicted metal-dependent hydrolase|uniref:cyclase family protein n=1 Tax=Brevibacillus TaxID=55080 RepID=UPI00156B2C02|nr:MULTISPECIES: cyclase family protein [Brevibacillus]UED67161.1 cyclase family protein [Brevibacillus sp. HD3.3A]
MRMFDVTAPIFEGMTVYKNKPEKQPKIQTVTNGYVTESRIDMDVHSGTHVDAPLHMVNDGETFESISLEKLVGNCRVLDLTHVEDKIGRAELEKFDIAPGEFLLFQTKNSQDDAFSFEFVYLAHDGAAYLAEKGVRGIGTDALGIERSQEGHPTHKTLFAAGIVVIEGLRLRDVPPGLYFMVAAPLKLVGTDAAPARVLLFEGWQEG